jgi:hypothetical protein
MTEEIANNKTRLSRNTGVWKKKYQYVAIKRVGIAEGKKIKVTPPPKKKLL